MKDDTTLDSLVSTYYQHIPDDDLAHRSEKDIAGAVTSHLGLAKDRPEGSARVRAFTPSDETDGWSCGRTVVEIVTDDMPFLVDSVSSELTRLGLPLNLVIHPVLRVRRDLAGDLIEVLPKDVPDAEATGTLRESWMHVEVDQTAADPALIEASLRAVLSDVRDAVDDWSRMRAQACTLADSLDKNPPKGVPAQESHEAAEFLRWVADDNFTFLGYREYDLIEHDGKDSLRAVPGSGLGVLRSDPQMARERELSSQVRTKAREPEVLILTKANSRSTVHRPAYLDYIGVKKFDDKGAVTGERRFLGLYAASAYSHSVREVPVLRHKVDRIRELVGFDPQSHSGKDVLQFLETYPRDELFQATAEDIASIAVSVHQNAERRQTRLYVRRDPYERFVSCLVYLPRDRYNTETRLRIQEILAEAYDGDSIDYTARVTESVLARLHIVVRAKAGATIGDADTQEVQARIASVVRSWEDAVGDALRARVGEAQAVSLLATYIDGYPESYKQEVPPEAAVKDITLAQTLESESEIRLRLYAPDGDSSRYRRLKILRTGATISLSQVLPVLASLGVEVTDERPYDIERAGTSNLRIYDFGMNLPEADPDGGSEFRRRFESAFEAIWFARCEADLLNGLVVRSGMAWEDIVILRAYVRYLQQAGTAFGLEYVESTLLSNAAIAGLLVDLFKARFDPSGGDGREAREDEIVGRIKTHLNEVASLDQDRILRSILGMVQATLRTNFYQRDSVGRALDRFSIKVDPQRISDLPLPRPRFEIWVYSPRVEGVHLRFGRIARGGLRWSDRRADFRTEVLGLVKAQEVKNAVIVPVGAKGGFLPKALPDPSRDREAWMTEGRAAYATFVRGLLDITDNRVEGRIVPPRDVVRHDGDDPYLVVAADKGTATFSDLANSVAAEYDFWLGDAFASGGSAGYDHKAMGITAKGAWISVQQHFREMGIDTQTQDFTACGIGDMSGDVFGNGMLLSPHIKLVAAFDHRHIFLDPTPDPATSFAERERLFALPRSSWDDYDRALISPGGGIYGRELKSIELTSQVKQALGIAGDESALEPAELIRRILTAPVDLLWNGGIGTYVKAQTQTNMEVGDKANDAVRVNGNSLRCQVVGEGGNLGLTQLGRVEASRHGVRLNTDAIDNSAGVDTSDHEVNIKILLDAAVRDGELAEADRLSLLESMTDEIATLVLRDNYEQNKVLSNARGGAHALLSVHARMISDLDARGIMNRAIEYLPDDEEITTRAVAGQGLTTPELAVLLAFAKISLTADLEGTGLADDPWFERAAVDYFPQALRERFARRIATHPLRDEIISTVVVNYLINNGGISVVFRACEETGASPLEVVRAASATIAIFDLPDFWRRVDALDNLVPTQAQTAMYLESRRLLDRGIRWMLQSRGGSLDVAAEVARFAPAVRELSGKVPDELIGIERERLDRGAERFQALGCPADLALQSAALMDVFCLLDVVQVADRAQQPPAEVMPLYFALSERYDVDRLLLRITALPRGDRWTALARQALRTDLYAALAGLCLSVLRGSQQGQMPLARIKDWEERNSQGLSRARNTLDEITAQETGDIATLSVALRVLRNLVAQGRAG